MDYRKAISMIEESNCKSMHFSQELGAVFEEGLIALQGMFSYLSFIYSTVLVRSIDVIPLKSR